MLSKRTIGFVLVLISGASFGALGIFATAAFDDGVHPFTALFLRFAIASAVLLALCMARGLRFPRGRLLLSVVLLGGVGYVGQATAYFLALTYASPGLVALLLYFYPALVAAASVLFFREPLGLKKFVALLLALGGTALTIGPVGGGRLVGVLLGLTAALTYAGYILASSRILPRLEATMATTLVSCSATVMFGLMMLIAGPQWPASSTGWWAVIGLALVSTVIAILLLFIGMKRVGPVIASMLSATEPLVAVFLSALLLHEQLTVGQWIGGAMILAAVVWLAATKPATETAAAQST